MTGFETWFRSANTGVYIGLLFAGWVGMVIGYKQGSDGSFAILKYNLQDGFEKLATIENGTFSWWAG